MRRLIFRTAASEDLRQISRYTKSAWGTDQARKYAAQLRERIKALREFPLRHPRVETRPGLHRMRCGQHTVIYCVSDDAIEIVRILHIASDFDAWLV
ncbi:type II toxin-antitoxin system RelE/ParE family toxin [Novosphingobium beihaiensis]|uniref:Type II toxin-antitoxin system RelE/ParE family toxin n=1 Tax=Novosphingobium beihaiensis TaxID=2930389 RepID=A0ABT0BJV8_9SPHN|nr:type II toxin-antitoxin system RelE/ParE family toxin [Novosphingobium beihaiensis]MCJ2185332.1 type II toxin-antitoxin system RelE/ParE family toxin [Novosphingobium beihaiensis]